MYLLPMYHSVIFITIFVNKGARSGAVGCGIALQAGRLRVWFPAVSLEFFIDIILQFQVCELSRRGRQKAMCMGNVQVLTS
jgi:hypothetical protein